MEALVPAFVAALLCQATDRSARLSAVFADRYRRPVLIALLAIVISLFGYGVAATGALLIAPSLTPEVRVLLLALALAIAGIDGIRPLRKLARFEHARLGPVFTPLLGLALLGLGDRTQLLTFAIGARSSAPWLAAAGALAAAIVVHSAAAFCGERGWCRLPLAGLRIVSAMAALITAALLGLAGFRLI